MGAVEIRPYDFDRDLSARFARLRCDLYRGDPAALGMTPEGIAATFEPSFGFHRDPRNRHRHFAALDGERLVGHVSAFVNADLADGDGTPVVTLGMFECVAGEEVGRALVDAALAWLREVAPDARVWAPMDFDIWHRYRFRVRGHDVPGIAGEPVNPAWYPSLFERCGFAVRDVWETTEIDGAAELREIEDACRPSLDARVADGYRFGPVARSDLATFHALVLDSFSGFLGFTPVSFDTFRTLFGPRWSAADLRLARLVHGPPGEPVGFTLAYPEGPLIVMFMVGVTQAEIALRHGIGHAACADSLRCIREAGHHRVVFALMARGSRARGPLHAHTGDVLTAHALYQRERP